MLIKVIFLKNLTYQLHLSRFSYNLSLVVLFISEVISFHNAKSTKTETF